MKMYASVNTRLKPLGIETMVTDLKESGLEGVELAVLSLEEEDKEWSREYVRCALANGLGVQFHSVDLEVVSKQSGWLGFYKELAEMVLAVQDQVLFVVHPFSYEDRFMTRKENLKAIQKMSIWTGSTGLNIKWSLENLNRLGGVDRTDLDGVADVGRMLENHWNFCWDVGHQLIDNKVTERTPDVLANRIGNMHIHGYQEVEGNRVDHYPIGSFEEEMMTALRWSAQYGYQGNVVMEIAVGYLEGETLNDQWNVYIEEMKTWKGKLDALTVPQ